MFPLEVCRSRSVYLNLGCPLCLHKNWTGIFRLVFTVVEGNTHRTISAEGTDCGRVVSFRTEDKIFLFLLRTLKELKALSFPSTGALWWIQSAILQRVAELALPVCLRTSKGLSSFLLAGISKALMRDGKTRSKDGKWAKGEEGSSTPRGTQSACQRQAVKDTLCKVFNPAFLPRQLQFPTECKTDCHS